MDSVDHADTFQQYLTKWTSLVYLANNQKALDTTINFQWHKVQDAEEYYIQLSIDPSFTNIDRSDSTTDTIKTFTGLLLGKRYNWLVKAKTLRGQVHGATPGRPLRLPPCR